MITRARLAAGIAAVALAGCGGGDGGASKADFIGKANRICADGNAAVAGLAREIARAQRASDPREVYRRVAALTRRAAASSQPYLDRLDALDTPAADHDRLKAWIADVRRQQALVAELAGAFSRRDETAVARLSERIDQLDQRNNRFAAQYGMRECARSA